MISPPKFVAANPALNPAGQLYQWNKNTPDERVGATPQAAVGNRIGCRHIRLPQFTFTLLTGNHRPDTEGRPAQHQSGKSSTVSYRGM